MAGQIVLLSSFLSLAPKSFDTVSELVGERELKICWLAEFPPLQLAFGTLYAVGMMQLGQAIYRSVNTAGSSIMNGVDHVRPLFMLTELKK